MKRQSSITSNRSDFLLLGEAGCFVALYENEEDKHRGPFGALGCICMEAVGCVLLVLANKKIVKKTGVHEHDL